MLEHILQILRGKATEKEVEEVKGWLEESEDNIQIYNEICKSYYQLQYMQQWNTIDSEKPQLRIKHEYHRKVQLRRWRYGLTGIVAMLMLCLGSIVFFHTPQKQWEQTADAAMEMKAGEKKAVLTLADGRKVELKANNTVMTLGHVQAEEDSVGGLVYKKINDSAELVTQYNTLTVPRAGEYILTLSDGTRVWLNSETELRYPVVFTGASRTVYVEGEAYFEVTKDAEHPFIVHTPATQTIVYGTSFNVMAYREERKTEITLVEGSVSVKTGKESRQIVPGEQILVDNLSGHMQQREVNVSYYASWKDGLFDFESMNLEELALKLSRWYDVDFFFANPAAGEKRFTGAIKRNNSLQFMLDFIHKTSGVRFVVKGKTVSVYNQ